MTTKTMPVTVPLEPTTPIKPSEALRLGRLTRPVTESLLHFWGRDAACAIGAIAVGYGFGPDHMGSWLSPDDRREVTRRLGGYANARQVVDLFIEGFDDGPVIEWLEAHGL